MKENPYQSPAAVDCQYTSPLPIRANWAKSIGVAILTMLAVPVVVCLIVLLAVFVDVVLLPLFF